MYAINKFIYTHCMHNPINGTPKFVSRMLLERTQLSVTDHTITNLRNIEPGGFYCITVGISTDADC